MTTQITKTRGLDDIRQLTNFIKEPFLSTDKRAEKEPVVPSSTESEESSPFYKLTRMTYEALVNDRHQRDKSVPSVIAFIDHWLTFLNDRSTTEVDVPSSWMTEILTTYLELKLGSSGQWTEEQVMEFIDKHYHFLHLPRLFFLCNSLKMDNLIRYLHDKEDKEKGSQASKDSLKEILEQLIAQKDATNALQVLRKSNNLGSTLRYIHTLCDLSLRPTVDYCVQCYPSVRPWNLEFLRGNVTMYLHYLTELMNSHLECHREAPLVEQWFEYALLDAAPPLTQLAQPSNTRLPCKGSHLIQWQHQVILSDIIDSTSKYSYNATHLKLLCEKYGYFKGLIQLYIKSNQTRKAISFLLESDDMSTLATLMANNYDVTEWKYLIAQLEKLEMSTDNDTPREITQQRVVSLMCIALGVKTTLEVLMERISTVQLPLPILVNFVHRGSIEEQQRQLIHEVSSIRYKEVTLTSSRCWRCTLVMFGPCVHRVSLLSCDVCSIMKCKISWLDFHLWNRLGVEVSHAFCLTTHLLFLVFTKNGDVTGEWEVIWYKDTALLALYL